MTFALFHMNPIWAFLFFCDKYGYRLPIQNQEQLSEQQTPPFFRSWLCGDAKREQLLQKSLFFKKSLLAVDLHAPTSEAVAGYL